MLEGFLADNPFNFVTVAHLLYVRRLGIKSSNSGTNDGGTARTPVSSVLSKAPTLNANQRCWRGEPMIL